MPSRHYLCTILQKRAMAHSFEIDLKGSPSEFIGKAKSALEKAGGTFNGNETKGSMAVGTPVGNISARYEISGTRATIHIDDKPFLLSVNTIKGALSKYLS